MKCCPLWWFVPGIRIVIHVHDVHDVLMTMLMWFDQTCGVTVTEWRAVSIQQIIGIPASAGLDVNVRRLGNAIVYSRFNKNRSSGTQCVVTLFKAKVISRVNVEYQFARFQNTEFNYVEQ